MTTLTVPCIHIVCAIHAPVPHTISGIRLLFLVSHGKWVYVDINPTHRLRSAQDAVLPMAAGSHWVSRGVSPSAHSFPPLSHLPKQLQHTLLISAGVFAFLSNLLLLPRQYQMAILHTPTIIVFCCPAPSVVNLLTITAFYRTWDLGGIGN